MSIAADAVSEPLWTGEVAVPDQPRHAVDYNPVTGGAGYNPHGPSGGGGAGESCAVSDLNTQSATWSDGDGAGGSCRFPTFVESWDVASLGSTCVIDLGDCPLYDLRASVSSSFEATTDHDTFLRGALPVWAAKIDALGWEDTWEAAGNALNRVSFDSYPETWGAGGLYWSGERFLWRAFRYAVATLYAYAFVVDEVPVFANAAGIDGDTIRRRFDNRGFLIDVVRVCDYRCDTLSVSSNGLVSARRDWKAVVGLFPYAAVTPAPWYCTFNDGWHLSAAIADSYFWWGLRLHDYALAGGLSSAEAGRYEFLSRLCARAALAEIVEIASVLLHEFSHSTGWPGSGWECKFHQECSHFNLGWYFSHRMFAEHGLPLPLLPGAASTTRRPRALSGAERSRFDFTATEFWTHKYVDPYFAEHSGSSDCHPAEMSGYHASLWEERHVLAATWDYPGDCARDASSGSSVVVP